ncbi:MAG: S8 family serine peptidase [Candidatus Krumholzibacteria bacterium]|jgi:hypothetical protein|nr:S8 family serine peptidase [Candidatus Krumholzibacteria bacterium]MDP6668587.1 S8 family serine peptidase [Candidatus Krumholzibacteria bacterium]MDP6797149.1 S8 family serine peptidase [Candidatus Krumholzibacteria bacterium]MDP7021344.1 S8 family serine peptidase [Candidatus Krumholzibacteria bacterium]
MRLRLASLLILLSLLATAAEIAEGLEERIAENGTLPVWVFFRDKGEISESRFEEARGLLSEAAFVRRAKVRSELLTERDLPLDEAMLQGIRDKGITIRAESRWLNAVSVLADKEALRELSALDYVRFLRPVAGSSRRELNMMPAPPSSRSGLEDPIDYGNTVQELQQINVPPVHQLGIHGEGVIVGMLDTGFNTNHEALADLDVLGTWDFINDDPVVSNEDGDPDSQENHGTMTLSSLAGYMPGTHVGVAFGASFYLAKTEDVSQEIPLEEDHWVEGIEWLEAQGCQVVSSSLGYYDWYVFDDMDGNTAVTTIAADYAVSLGVVVVNSAGNSRNGFGHIIAPADGDSVIAVAAVDENGEFASFSSPGPSADGRIKPDVSARGVANHVAYPGTWDEYTLVSGTSLSCPLSAGVAALLLSAHPDATPMEIRDAMRETADRADNPDNDYGWGILDAEAALEYLTFTASPASTPRWTLHAWPNPFNPKVRIEFSLEEATFARLEIHDLKGRLLDLLLDESLAAGTHSLLWHGKDREGRELPSGIYFARLVSGQDQQVRKMLLLK